MIPCELVLRNFMCYRDDLPPLRFDGLHVTCLSGDNGVGKSALLDAITWALWGRARMKSDDDLIALGEYEMLVELVFFINQQRYRVIRRRQRARSGKGSSGKSFLDLHVSDGQQWRAIGGNTIADTERIIEQNLLHMSYDTFINASFLMQGRADEFTRKTAAERKQVLVNILDLSDYEKLEDKAKQRAKKLDNHVQNIDGIISHLQMEVDKLGVYEQFVRDAQQKVEILENQLQQAEQAKQQADEQVRILEGKLARRKDIGNRLVEIERHQQEQEQEIAQLRGKIEEATTLLQRRDVIMQGIAELATAKQEQEHLESLRPRYDDLREKRRQLQEALKDECRTLQHQLSGLQQEARRFQQQIARRPALEKELSGQQQRLAALAPLVGELTAIREQRTTFDEHISQANVLLRQHSELVHAIRQRKETLVAKRDECQRTITRLERQLKDVARWQSNLDEALQQHQHVQALTSTIAEMRTREQTITQQVGELRALSKQYKQQMDDLKKRQMLFSDTQATTCPLCGSDLGEHGTATIIAHYQEEMEQLQQRIRNTTKEENECDKQLAQLRRELQGQEQDLALAQQGAARVESLQHQIGQATEWQSELEQLRVTLTIIEQQLASEDYEHEAREALLTVEATLVELGAEKISETKRKGERKDATTWSIEGLEQQRKTLQQRQSDLEHQLEARTTIEQKIATLQLRLDEIEQATVALPPIENQIHALDNKINQNDFGQEIRIAGRAVEKELADLGYTPEGYEAIRERVKQLSHWSEEERRLSIAESNLELYQQNRQKTEELLSQYVLEREQLNREDRLLEEETRSFAAVQQHAKTWANSVSHCLQELDMTKRDLYEKEALHKRAVQSAEDLAQKKSEHTTLVKQRSIFQELAESFGKKGVQAMLIETAIPEIEREANRLLGRMTDNQMHVTFEMQRNTKKGDTVETLEIKIADGLGTRAYDAFSGGEAMRINFAIRVALSRLLARRAGASLETLVIDEGFGALDVEGRERFVEAITSVQQDFKCILVITHLEDLKERFPAQIQITKTSKGSVWEIV